MRRLRQVGFMSRVFVFLLLLVCLGLWQVAGVFAAGTATGRVFRDYNANGTQDVPGEPGIPNVQVTGFDATGVSLGTILTNALGDYSYNWVTADTTIRLEFVAAAGFQPGANGGMSDTTVQFVTNGSVADVGFNRPRDYCQQNPNIATNCYQFGAQSAARDVIVQFGYTNGTTAAPWNAPAVDAGGQTALSLDGQVGTTWGLSYQAMTGNLFAGAFMKRHSGFGPGGPCAIYRIDTAAAPTGSVFYTIPNCAGAAPFPLDPHADASFPNVDALSFDAVGKISLGDVDIFDDDQTLFAVSLGDQRVYQIGTVIGGGAPTLGAVSSYGFPVNPCPVPTDFRPFGLGVNDGLVYVGAVCSAESSQNPANLSAHIFVLTPGVGISAAPILSFPLNYTRDCVMRADPGAIPAPNGPTAFIPPGPLCNPAAWRPWTTTFQTNAAIAGFSDLDPYEFSYPQPILSDIEFDNNGDMVLGIRDRFGDQQGFRMPNPTSSNNPSGQPFWSADVAGDILRACFNGAGWVLENNSGCGGVASTLGAASNQGPGGGEFYFSENYPVHDETVQGGLLIIPGLPDVVMTAYDPIFDINAPYDGAILWLSNTDGSRTRAYRMFDDDINPPRFFGKGGSLGDLDAICDAAPIEIGNRVWFDADNDGRQSPNETPLAGVTVQLRDSLGNVIATAVTDANGNYLFSNGTGPGSGSSIYGIPGLDFLTTGYTVTIDLTQPAITGPGYVPAILDTGGGNGEDNRDSDGLTAGTIVLTTFNTGVAGANNHTYDFGFVLPTIPTATPIAPTPVPGTGGGTGGGTGTNPVVVITPNPPFSQPGGTVIWTITIVNPTNNPMPNVSFTKTEPDNIQIISISTSGGTAIINGQVINFTIDVIGPNQTITIILETQIDGDTPVPFVITNTVILGAPYTGRASANVISATLLPATGDFPLWIWLTAFGVSALAALLLFRRHRRTIT
jgi:uncharacterized repeat protein (TIGR01451 family)